MYLNAITVSSCSGRLGAGTTKGLHMCSSWEELEEKVQRDSYTQVKIPSPPSVEETLDNLNKMCLVAVIADMENDEELAFVNYSRYRIACSNVLFKKNDDNFSEMIKIEENMRLTVKILEVLKRSLTGRYKKAAFEVQQLENGIKIVRPVLEQHRANIEAEIQARNNLKRTREELKSLYLISQLLEQQTHQQQNSRRFEFDNNNNVPEQLQCPVCFEVYLDQVFQCNNGHNICSACYKDGKLDVCPECRNDFGDTPVRNRALEGLVSTWGFDCPYRENGCPEKVLCKQLAKHSESCLYKKSEKRRKIAKVEMQIQEKEVEVNKYQAKLLDVSARRMKSKTEWWKLELNDKFGTAVERVVQELNLLEIEQEV